VYRYIHSTDYLLLSSGVPSGPGVETYLPGELIISVTLFKPFDTGLALFRFVISLCITCWLWAFRCRCMRCRNLASVAITPY